MQKNGIPVRFYRFCCDKLKEYKVLYNVVIGVRRSESVKRAARYHEPIVCRVFNKKKDIREQQILPILYWTEEDLLEFIEARNIKLHPLYYREDGTIDIKRRLGCLCCPLQGDKKRIEDFKKYPKMLEAYIRNARIFWETHPHVKTVKKFRSAEEWCFCELLCESYKTFKSMFIDCLFPVEPEWFIDYFEREFHVSLRDMNKNF